MKGNCKEMSSFKFYLPSNACPNVYPSNSPTDFRIALDNPLTLEGNWEVGMESICYSSQIHDDSERASMNLKVGKVSRPLLNSEYNYHYRVSADESWPGFIGVKPTHFETDPKKIDGVLNTLNSLNDKMLTLKMAFLFQRNLAGDVVFHSLDDGLFLCLTPRLAKVIGFRQTIGRESRMPSYGREVVPAPFNRITEGEPLTQADYHVRYLHIHLQQVRHTITVKWNGTTFDGTIDSLKTMWKTIPFNIDLDVKDEKVIITNHHKDFAIDLSPHMKRVLNAPWPIIGNNTSHSTYRSQVWNLEQITKQHWYVDVYSTAMVRTRRYTYKDIPLSLMPWKSNTIRELLFTMNRQVEKSLKRELQREYHSGRHHFSLRLRPSQHVTMKLGKRLEVEFSPNLAFLLGFPNQRYSRHQSTAVREVDALFNRSRQLHVLSNIVKPTAVGKQQRQIVRDFVHHSTNKELSVKHFDTISYVPVMTNRIDNIHMQLVNDMMEPVKVQDVKTLITLYFRKI